MKAGELSARDVVTAEIDDTIIEAAVRMAEAGVGDLVVVESMDGARRPIGIVTDRDLVTRALVRGEPLASVVRDVMDTRLVTAREDEDVEEVLATMRKQGVRRIPIVDAAGNLTGIVTLDDLVTWLAERMADVAGLLALQHSDA